MRVITLALLILCVFSAVSIQKVLRKKLLNWIFQSSEGGVAKKAAKAAANAALQAAVDAKNAAIQSAQESIDAITEQMNEMIRDIEAQIMDAIMKPVQKVTDILTTIDSIQKGFPNCVEKVQDHINSTVETMYDELDVCKTTAFQQTEDLFTDVVTSITNFHTHTTSYLKTFKKCVSHTSASGSRCTNIHHIAKATACATHATDNYQQQIRQDITTANDTLRAAPGRVPPIITGATACSVDAVDTAYNELTNTLNVIKACAGIKLMKLY